jgi:Papain family cysteine protease
MFGDCAFLKAQNPTLYAGLLLGGIAALVAGSVVFIGAWNYAAKLVDVEMRSVAETALPGIIQKEAGRQVAEYFKEHQPEYEAKVVVLTQQFISQAYSTIQSKLPYGLSAPSAEGKLPATTLGASVLDYTSLMGGVRDQGNEGSVVGFAIAYALEYQVLKTTGHRVRLSPREIYNLARSLEGTVSRDAGTRISDGVKVVETEGAVLEEIWPYKSGEFSAQPPKEFANAARYKVKQANKITGVEQIKNALRSTGPVVVGLTLYSSFVGGMSRRAEESYRCQIRRTPSSGASLSVWSVMTIPKNYSNLSMPGPVLGAKVGMDMSRTIIL